jgi:hypothetical protein
MNILFASIQYGFENSKDRLVFGFNQSVDSDVWLSTEGVTWDGSGEPYAQVGAGLRVRMSGGRFASDIDGSKKVLTPLSLLSQEFRDNAEVIMLSNDQPLEPGEEAQETAVIIGDDDGETSLLKIAHDEAAETIFVKSQTFGEPPERLELYPSLKQVGPWVPLPKNIVPKAYDVFSTIYEKLDTPAEREASLRCLVQSVRVTHESDPDFVEQFSQQMQARMDGSSDLEI